MEVLKELEIDESMPNGFRLSWSMQLQLFSKLCSR